MDRISFKLADGTSPSCTNFHTLIDGVRYGTAFIDPESTTIDKYAYAGVSDLAIETTDVYFTAYTFEELVNKIRAVYDAY